MSEQPLWICFRRYTLTHTVESRRCRAVFVLVTGGLLALLTIALAYQAARAAGPWYVAPDGDDGYDCLFPATACATINGAIAKASPGDTILIATGTYTDTDSAVVLLDKDVTLSGGWMWDGTLAMQSGTSIIDGEGARRDIVACGGVSATVELFVVQNGSSPDRGGGILNGGSLTLDDSVVSHNTAGGEGGGIFSTGGTITLNNSTVSDNTAANSGGGIGGDGMLTLNNSTVSGNTSTEGGGMYVWHNGATTVTLNSSTVHANTASQGGGIHSGGSSPTVTVILRNSILAGNASDPDRGPDCSGAVVSWGYNLVGDTSGCNFIRQIGDLTHVSANLGPLSGFPGYHPLLSGSPAIDAGNPEGCLGSAGPLTADQRGFARFGRCDIGAYEAQSSKSASVPTIRPGHQLTFTIAAQNGGVNLAGFWITDTLPLSLTYVDHSLIADSGSYGHENGVITWTGSLTDGKVVRITFGATVSQTIPIGASIVNSAVISGGGERVTRTSAVDVDGRVCNLVKYADNPVLSEGAESDWDEDDVWAPTVLKEEGVYRMWYTGDAGSDPFQIGLASSSDGVNWVRNPDNPVLSPSETWEVQGVGGASVVSEGGMYRMWYAGFDNSGTGRIGYAVSPDGVTWAKYSGNPVLDVGALGGWEDSEVIHPTVIRVDEVYHMWYEGHDGITARIGHATSSDGVTWLRDPDNPLLDTGLLGDWDWLHVRSPGVVAYGGSYLLMYSGETLPSASQIGYALSSNGRDWDRREMLVPENDARTFDARGASHASAVADSDSLYVWYTGMDDSGSYRIGYATAEMCDVSIVSTTTPDLYLPVVMKGWHAEHPCSPGYVDDFSDSGSGWPAYEDSDAEIAYTGGQYQIWLKKPSLGRLVTPGAKATDFAVAVSARRTSGNYGVYGIVFGVNEDWSELYQVHIEASYYSIWRRSGETWIALQYWTPSDHIHTGTSWNRLKVVRDGVDIALYLNDQHLTTVTDGSFTGLRRIGLVAYSPSSGSLDVRFDDFALYPADCGVGAAGAGFEMGEPEIRFVPQPLGMDRLDRFSVPQYPWYRSNGSALRYPQFLGPKVFCAEEVIE
jgi:uncharacterized repeat protein (TIGR01451 family)